MPKPRRAIKTRSIRTPSPTGSHHRRSRSSLRTSEQRQRKRGRNAQSGHSSRGGPRVRRLIAGGRWIRTFGSAPNPLPFSETAVPSPMTVDGLVTGARNRKSESISLQQRVGRNRRTPLPTSWRARKGLPSWIREAENLRTKTLDPETGPLRRTFGWRQCSWRRSASRAPSDGEQGWRLRSSALLTSRTLPPAARDCGPRDPTQRRLNTHRTTRADPPGGSLTLTEAGQACRDSGVIGPLLGERLPTPRRGPARRVVGFGSK